MRLRPLTRADLETVRLLRNHSRESFFDTCEIAADQQLAWFERLHLKPVAFFVIEEDGRVVGTISVTDGPDGREVGNLTLAPACRGRGLMRQAVMQLTTSPGRYFADVKGENQPSLSVFRAAGFSEESSGNTVRLWKSVTG